MMLADAHARAIATIAIVIPSYTIALLAMREKDTICYISDTTAVQCRTYKGFILVLIGC